MTLSVTSPAILDTSWSDPSRRRVSRSPPGVEFRQNVEVCCRYTLTDSSYHRTENLGI